MSKIYFESTIDETKVVSENKDRVVVCDTKHTLCWWWDTFVLLKNQSAEVSKYLYKGKWYRLQSSVCEDQRTQNTHKKFIAA